jgi:hypothetical protein
VTSRAAGFSPPVVRDTLRSPSAGGSRPTITPMSPDDRDDPGADTAMFRAYVDEGSEPAAGPSAVNRWAIAAIAAAVVVVLVVALIIL